MIALLATALTPEQQRAELFAVAATYIVAAGFFVGVLAVAARVMRARDHRRPTPRRRDEQVRG
jgi:hypothetical protein